MSGLDFFQKQKIANERMAKKASTQKMYITPKGGVYVETSPGMASECFVDLDDIVRVFTTPIPIQKSWRLV